MLSMIRDHGACNCWHGCGTPPSYPAAAPAAPATAAGGRVLVVLAVGCGLTCAPACAQARSQFECTAGIWVHRLLASCVPSIQECLAQVTP
jgi:hypothetical protein